MGNAVKRGDVLAAYRAYLDERRFAPGTVKSRERAAARWTADVRRWPTATWRDVERWAAGLDVSQRTAAGMVRNVSAFYLWAVSEGLAESDPTKLADMPRLPTQQPRTAPVDQVEQLVAGDDVEVAAMAALMADGGLRCRDLAELDWSHVNLGEAYVHTPDRIAALPPRAVAALAALDGVDGPVFPGADGGARSAARVSQLLNAELRRRGWSTTADQLRRPRQPVDLADLGRRIGLPKP